MFAFFSVSMNSEVFLFFFEAIHWKYARARPLNASKQYIDLGAVKKAVTEKLNVLNALRSQNKQRNRVENKSQFISLRKKCTPSLAWCANAQGVSGRRNATSTSLEMDACHCIELVKIQHTEANFSFFNKLWRFGWTMKFIV